jgi:hypothetical protein
MGLIAGCSAWGQSIAQPEIPTGLLVRRGDTVVDAPPGDFLVAKGYSQFPDKGPVKRGERLTLLTASTQYKVGEPIRVLHVLESLRPKINVYVMGSKAISDEYVDGHLVTPKGPLLVAYDGAVINRPIADFNYDITTYTFTQPGRHTIQWKGYAGLLTGEVFQLESNLITITVVK